jgi:DNA repair exonuclease SbcCD ATPase subunit
MRIVQLVAENFKKIRAVEITPTGDLVQITGANEAGKSSILDAIWAALKNADHVQAMPIRKGAEKARIKLDLGELVVERKFSAQGSVLTVSSAEGARFTSPQGILDKLLGALTFDPLAFVHQEEREQFESLRKIVPLEVDLDQLDGLNRADYDKRTEINRQAKQLRAQADGIAVPDALPAEPVNTGALKDRMGSASESNAAIERDRGGRSQRAEEAKGIRQRAQQDIEEAARVRKQAEDLEERAKRQQDKAEDIEGQLAAMPELAAPVDVAAIRAELDQAEIVNRGIEQRSRKATLQNQAKALEEDASGLTHMMEARTTAKTLAISAAKMPVPGLSFGDGIVTFEGVPFSQASSAEQLKVSVAIAMAANPKLRVLRIQEGSLLDDRNLALIAEMAKAQDYQVWIERVDTSGKIGITIEDGSVVAVDGQPVAAAKEKA